MYTVKTQAPQAIWDFGVHGLEKIVQEANLRQRMNSESEQTDQSWEPCELKVAMPQKLVQTDISRFDCGRISPKEHK